jgi:hypothetical protein
MPQPEQHDPERGRNMKREQVFRELKSLLDLYWSLCGSWVVCDRSNATELRLRMLNTRETVMALVEALMPNPGVGPLDEGRALPSPSESLH